MSDAVLLHGFGYWVFFFALAFCPIGVYWGIKLVGTRLRYRAAIDLLHQCDKDENEGMVGDWFTTINRYRPVSNVDHVVLRVLFDDLWKFDDKGWESIFDRCDLAYEGLDDGEGKFSADDFLSEEEAEELRQNGAFREPANQPLTENNVQKISPSTDTRSTGGKGSERSDDRAASSEQTSEARQQGALSSQFETKVQTNGEKARPTNSGL